MKVKRYLAIDWGQKRIGLAYADEDLKIAFPLPCITIQNEPQALKELEQLIVLKKIDFCVIGLPLNMDGSEGSKAQIVSNFAHCLHERTGIPYALSDETLTTYEASHQGISSKKKRNLKDIQKDRKSGKIDSQSAVIILQDYLNEEQNLTSHGDS